MPALYAHFAAPVPTQILALDYLDREAEFRSLAREPARAALAVRELAKTWASTRPKVLAAQGAGEAAAFDRHVAAMTRLATGPGSALRAEAVRGLELVDELESVFG
jgi:MoxR-like ATPase